MSSAFRACAFAAVLVGAALLAGAAGGRVWADDSDTLTPPVDKDLIDPKVACAGLPSFDEVRQALIQANREPGGLSLAGASTPNNMWATVVNRDGVVCAVVTTGTDRGDQWPGGRLISAGRANTANAFSLPKFAYSTANLYAAVQPGGAMFCIEVSNPVATPAAYRGDPATYGTSNDPMIGRRVGGINVTGGGVALYERSRLNRLVGAIGVSGDTACRDHRVAWVARAALRLDAVPAGVNTVAVPSNAAFPDNIIYDMGFGSTTIPPTGITRMQNSGSRPWL